MKVIPLCAAFCLALALASATPVSAAQDEGRSPGVTHVAIEGELDIGTLALVHRAVEHARDNGNRLLVEIDTPGGEVELMWKISSELLDASQEGVLVAGWVNSRAWSAGALIAMACEMLFIRSAGGIGSAQPITLTPGGIKAVSPDIRVKEKFDSTLRSTFRGVAEERGRPAVIAEGMIDPDVVVIEVSGYHERFLDQAGWNDVREQGLPVEYVRELAGPGELINLTGREAVDAGIADAICDDLDAVLDRLGVRGVEPVRLERTPSEELASFLYTFGWAFLGLGLFFGWVELKVPGFGIPGMISILCLGVFVAGRYLVGLADVPHVVLLTVGVVLLAVELFVVPGTLWAGFTGAIFLLVGLAWTLAGPNFGIGGELSRDLLLDEATHVGLAALLALVGVFVLSRFLPNTPVFSRLVLQTGDPGSVSAAAMPEAQGEYKDAAFVGASGRTLTPLRPVGKVSLDGASQLEYEARSSGEEIAAGVRVRVAEVHGSGRLLVEAEEA